MSEFNISVDAENKEYSKDFKDFYRHHFVDSYSLSRGEAELSFFRKMTPTEVEIAKQLIRQNLASRIVHIIEAAGHLRDERALPALYDLKQKCKDELSRLLIIQQAIWRINGDTDYYDMLVDLVNHTDATMKQAHFHQILDLPGKMCIPSLFKLLKDPDGMVANYALKYLNYYMTGEYPKLFVKPKYSIEYFLDNADNEALLVKLITGKNTLS